jgi:hypothetical protein
LVKSKGLTESASEIDSAAGKWTIEIIHERVDSKGSGTVASSSKLLPPEKGESAGKSLTEGTFNYTLPSK